MFAAFVPFRKEEKNNGEEATGGEANLCAERSELGKTETMLLCSSGKSHEPLSRMLKAVPWSCVQRLMRWGRAGPGGRKRRERRC